MLKQFCLIILLAMPAFGVAAQDGARLEPLIDALQLHDIFSVMRDEGINYGRDLDREMLNDAGGVEFRKTVEEIYDAERIWKTFYPKFAAELDSKEIDAMGAYWGTHTGRQIVSLEVSARRALLDAEMEEASLEALRDMVNEGDPRLAMLKDFIEANDLVEFNVMGAMNANFAFYNGMIEGQAFDYDLSEADILNDVWSQEAEIRIDIEEWIYSYLAMAYQPLPDEDLQSYIDFSKTKAGRDLNAALFAGFDDVFINVSRALGLAVAGLMQGEDL